MNISLLEPIGISQTMIEDFSKGLKEAGHSFTYYDTKTTDVEELKRRSAGQDIVMIANTPYPDEVVRTCDSLKMIAVAFTGIFANLDDTGSCKQLWYNNYGSIHGRG